MNGFPWICAAALGVAACGGGSPTPTEARAPQRAPAPADEAPMRRQVADVTVHRVIVEACGIPTPHFAFDSAEVRPRAEAPLEQLAACFLTGPLAGRDVLLIGHADPRGTVQYNIALGHQRAHQVADALRRAGLPSSRIGTMSHGDLFAKGTDASTWRNDRRVEIWLRE